MAFYYVFDGVVDTAVAFEDGSEFASFAQFMRASVANELGNIDGNRTNVAAGVAPVDIAPDRAGGDEGQVYNALAFLNASIEDGWFSTEDVVGGSISGSLVSTLDSLTLSGSASLSIAGQLNSTLGALTGAGNGSVNISANLAGQLSPVTLAATGALSISGQVTATLGAVTLAATGTLSAAGITGSLAATLDALTVSSTATLALQGQVGATLGAVTGSGNGSVAIGAALAGQLSPVALVSTGSLSNSGQVSQTLGALTLSASGTLGAFGPITGTLDVTLGELVLSATGTVENNNVSLYQTYGGIVQDNYERKKKAAQKPVLVQKEKPLEIVSHETIVSPQNDDEDILLLMAIAA